MKRKSSLFAITCLLLNSISYGVGNNIYCPDKISCTYGSWCDAPSPWRGAVLSNIEKGTYSFWYSSAQSHNSKSYQCVYKRQNNSTVTLVTELKLQPDLTATTNRWSPDSEAFTTYKCIGGEQSPHYCPFIIVN